MLVGVVCAIAVAPASAATDAFAVHYEGSYAWHQDWEGGAGATGGSYLRTTESLSWVMDVSGSKAGPGLATDVHVKLSAQGTIDEQGSDPNANEHCTMTQASGGGSGDVTVGRNSDGTLNVGLGVPSSVGGDLVVTGNHQNCDEFAGSVLFCDTSSCAGATVTGPSGSRAFCSPEHPTFCTTSDVGGKAVAFGRVRQRTRQRQPDGQRRRAVRQ